MPNGENKKPLVLIVDDDEDICSGIRVVLENSGYETFVVANAEEAKIFLMDRKPDVMTLDINMPEVTGIELLDSLQGSDLLEGVKVIVVSGQPTDDLIDGMLAGADWVLEKPLDFIELLQTVDRLMANSGNKAESNLCSV